MSGTRRKDIGPSSSSESGQSTGGSRTEAERDFDRILFTAPTRRLADKTQVFPLDPNDSVRNRLTHSHEVSNLARSIGTKFVYQNYKEIFGEEKSEENKSANVRNVPAILAAAALAHDLGNPPFGHQGETAIRQWFDEKKCSDTHLDWHADFLNFDGNAQTFRLVTKLQLINDNFGLNLTCGCLAALLKYPSLYDTKSLGGYKKFGVFDSERDAVKQVWSETGLLEGQRHPLAYVMESCDDIAYCVLDSEDTVTKGYASYNDIIKFLINEADGDPMILDLVEKVELKCKRFKDIELSVSELNDLSMQYFRVHAIYHLVEAASETFTNQIDNIMSGTEDAGMELIKKSKAAKLCKLLKSFSKKHGFNHTDVLSLELEGNNTIKSTMDMLWCAINSEKKNTFEVFAYQRISENYRRIFEQSDRTNYNKCQLLTDAISGMTDSYLTKLHKELRPLYNGYRS